MVIGFLAVALLGLPPGDEFARVAEQAASARDAARIEEATELYRRAVALKPDWDEGWWYLGTLHYSSNQLEEALDSFSQIIRRNPKAGPAYAFRGLCEFQLHRYGRAFEDLDRARAYGIGEDVKLVTAAQYELGILFNRYGSHDQGYKILTEVARADPEAPGLVEALGLTVLHLPYLPSEMPEEKRELVLEAGRAALDAIRMRAREAQQAYEQLVARHPGAAGVHYALGWFLLEQDPDRAVKEFQRELEIDPGNGYARLQIALVLLRNGDYAAAVPYARQAAQAEPNWFMTRQTYGRTLLETGQAGAAIRELEASARLEPANPQTHFQLARAYRQSGRAADAAREQTEFTRLSAKR